MPNEEQLYTKTADGYWAQNIQTVGRLTKQVVGHNAAAIRSTSANDVDVDVAAYPGMKAMVVSNTADQQVTVTLYAKSANYTFAALGNKTVNAGSALIFTDTDYPALRSAVQKLTIRGAYAVAPASGSLSTYIEGVV